MATLCRQKDANMNLHIRGFVVEDTPTLVGILKANYAFRGVPVNPGEHIIEMRFAPDSFRLGATISLATIFLL